MADMLIGGESVQGSSRREIRSPFSHDVIDSVAQATAADVDRALQIAVRGAAVMKATTGYDRAAWLQKAAGILKDRIERFAQTISKEEGKTIHEARFEVSRAFETLTLSAEEAKRIHGSGVPLDGAPGGANKLGLTLRVPCGVVVAITPFNFPLNLVCHKVGPALAGGNSVILKPASDTPLTAIEFVKVLLEAGIPPEALHCLTGPGKQLSESLCSDPRVRKISFTGSFEVGEMICKTAGVKRVTMELGSNSPLVVMDDADLDKVIAATVATGYGNAGQVCISTQRVLVDHRRYGDFLDGLKPQVESIVTGDPLQEATKMGPMIREADAKRVESWIAEAVSSGAKLVSGGKRDGSMVSPTIIADARPQMRIMQEELFGPAVAVMKYKNIDEAISLANDSRYGLAAAVFTESLSNAMKFVREVDSGNIHVNWGPAWRADLMPYGGLKDSGIGKEGPAAAIREMTEEKTIVFHL